MKKIDRYVARAYIIRFVMAHVVIFGLYVSFDIMQRVEMFYGAEVHYSLSQVLVLYLYQVPGNLMNTVPPLLMLSAGLVFVHMNKNGELLTLKSCGVSVRRVALPIFVVTILFAATLGMARETVIPGLYIQRQLLENRIEGRVSGPFYLADHKHGYRLYVEDYDFTRGEMSNVTILLIYTDMRVPEKILQADLATWGEEDAIQLERVSVQEFDRDGGRMGDPEAHETKTWPTSLAESDFADAQHQSSTIDRAPAMTLASLRDGIEESPHNPRFKVLFHSRITDKLVPVILLLIGIPMLAGSGHNPQNRLIGALIAILITGAYYVLTFIAISFGNAGTINPALAAWAVPAAGSVLGFIMFSNMRT